MKNFDLNSFRNVREKCRLMVEDLRKQQNDFTPGFAVVQVGNREDSNVYIRHKLKAAEEIGIQARLFRLDSSTTEQQVCLIHSFLKNIQFIFKARSTS
jgi:methylenetetrahydrofolate dehydrogenase (NADP+)/methenyltetrahydrofolate cyclohydrolase/formyltetrahydrofolate synthetase